MEKATKTPGESTGCIKAAAEILGAKWTPQLLYALCHKSRRFSELQKQLEGLNPRTLSARLEELVHCGILTKTSYAEVPPRIEYDLTPKGRDLIPILEQMVEWSKKHPPSPGCNVT